MKNTFVAPWATSLKVISISTTILLLGITWLTPMERLDARIGSYIRALPVILLGLCALYTVRGYEVSGGCLHVRRLLWVTRIPLRSLTDAEWRPGAFGWAWRTCGNGGLYSFSGWFHQKPLGSFRALATRTTDAVILKFSDRKPIVVTPENPARFVEAVKTANG